MTALAPASKALGAATALLAALPLVVGGLWADLLPDGGAPALDGALGLQLALAVWALPSVLAAVAPPAREPGRLGRAGVDLALVVAAAAPFVALAARFTSLPGDAVARGVAHALALLAALAAALALGGPRTPSARLALVAAWTAAAPLVVVVALDQLALDAPAWLAALSPALGQRAALEGRLGVALLGVVVAPLLLVGLGRRARSSSGSVSVGALAAVACLGVASVAHADPRVERAEPLLRDHVRPGEPWPLRLELDAGGGAWLMQAEGGRTRVVVPAASGAPTFVPAIPMGSAPIDLAARALETPDGAWLHLDADLPAPRALRTQELLVGHFGAQLPLDFVGGRRAAQVALEARDAPALEDSGHALDLIKVARGAARDARVAGALRLWAAAGGVAAFDDASDLVAVAGDFAAPGCVVKPWDVRPIGAGLLVGPAPGELGLVVPRGDARDREALTRASALLERLAGRLRTRSRRDAVIEAALAAGPPGPSRAVGRRAALAAACAALGLAFLLLAAGKLRRASAAGALLVAGLTLAVVLPGAAAPPVKVWAASTQVLEAPAGASAAGRVEVLTLAAPCEVEARVGLLEGGLPLPALVSVAAEREAAELFPGVRPALVAPVGPTHRAFVRVDAVALERPSGGPGGAFRLTRGRGGQSVQVENATNLPLDRVLAITSRGVYALGDLLPGVVHDQDLDLLVPPIPFARWRLGGDEDADERAWRALVTAALAGRDLSGQLVLVGRGPPARRVAGGVAGESPARPLVVITASEETSPR